VAQLVVIPINSTTITWYITGLSSPFNTQNYIRVTLSTNPAINGSPNPPSVILSSIYPITDTGGSTTTPSSTTTGGGAFSGGNTYTLYGSAQAANGLFYNAGSATFTMPVPRPNNFYWSYAGADPNTGTPITGSDKQSGLAFYLTATEFIGLFNRINQFRQYRGLPNFPFDYSSVYSGGFFYAYLFNQCVQAILPMNPPIPPPSTVSAGQIISASMLNGLKNSLNSIP